MVKSAGENGKLLMTGLNGFVDQYPQVQAVRGLGMMIGMVVEGSAKDVVDACRDMGLLCCTAGEHVVRLLPPLNVSESDLEEAMEMIGDALEQLFGNDEEE